MNRNRRAFLRNFGAAAAGTGLIPKTASGTKPGLPWPVAPVHDEAFWTQIKAQFPVRPGLIMMNAANLCPSPYPVIDTVNALTRTIDEDASFQSRSRFGPLHQDARAQIAAHIGALETEIAITRNTSESNNTVVNGIDLEPGDEVVLWDQNHPTNRLSWEVRAERLGFTIVEISTPENPTTKQELVDLFAAVTNSRTKVISFSHVSNVNGIQMPAREICSFARGRGILTHLDGAQSFGALALDMHEIGCDFFSGSSHKWFLGPKEAGLLYVRTERIEQLWATHVGVGYGRALQNGAQKFDNLGQRDDACVAAMGTAADLHASISPIEVEARIKALVAALREGISSNVPGVRFTGPEDPGLRGGVLVVVPPHERGGEMFNQLYQEHNIAVAPRGTGVRLSPHVYNTMEDVERVVRAVEQLS
jgi:isopenicillin-N epimerase